MKNTGKLVLGVLFLGGLALTSCKKEDIKIDNPLENNKEYIEKAKSHLATFKNNDDIDGNGMYGWTDNSNSFTNISAPIAISIFNHDKEESLRLFEDMVVSAHAENKLSSWDIYGFLFAYEKTGEPKYIAAANEIHTRYMDEYDVNSTRDEYFGFDSYGRMMMVKYINKYANELPSSLVVYASALETYYESRIADFTDANDNGYINTIYVLTGSGEPREVTLTGSLQQTCYAYLGSKDNTLLEFIKESIDNNSADVSEVAAEVLLTL